MRISSALLLSALLVSGVAGAAQPLRFEKNDGQADARVRFLHRGRDATLFITEAELVLSARSGAGGRSVVRMTLDGSRGPLELRGLDPIPGEVRVFHGSDPKRFHTHVSSYARVRAANVYPGIDLVYHGSDDELEYDFVVTPGADPRRITLAFEGAGPLHLERDGSLVIPAPAGELRHHPPFLYQDVRGERRAIAGGFVLKGEHAVGFRVGMHDASLPLVIDPILSSSTYLGGTGEDFATAVTTDAAGNVYVTGQTASANFPVRNALPGPYAGAGDIFVAKLDATLSTLLWADDIGGSGLDVASGIAVDAGGRVTIAGETNSPNFPVTPSAFQGVKRTGSDAFVLRLNAAGSAIDYATYLGGSGSLDRADAVALDASGNVYITGRINSTDFPFTPGAFQTYYRGGDFDSYVAKLDPSQSGAASLVYSTYLGGSENDASFGIAVDSAGQAYVTGGTRSPDFPSTPNAVQSGATSTDAFVSVLSASGTQLVYGTLLGGSGTDRGNAIALDGSFVIVAGMTASTDFPIKSATQPASGGGANDAFVTKLDPAGSASTSLIFSTYFGGAGDDRANGVALDTGGGVAVTGQTTSLNFPSLQSNQASLGGKTDAFLARLGPTGTLIDSTPLGGTGDDRATGIALRSGIIYLTGRTDSPNLSVLRPFQPALAGAGDAFVMRLDPGLAPPPGPAAPPPIEIPALPPAGMACFAIALALAGIVGRSTK